MTKKNRKKKNNKQAEIKSEEAQSSPMESDRLVPEDESFVSVQDTQEEIGEMSKDGQAEDHTDDNSISENTPNLSDEDSVEDLLDHVRQSFVTKKHREKKNVQGVEPGVAGAGEKPVEMSQPEPGVEPEVAEGSETLIEADQANPKMEPVDVDQTVQDDVVVTSQVEESKEDIQEPVAQEGEADASSEDSMDDILADVRHSLVEEDEAGKSGKKSSWWNRLVKGTSTQETPVVAKPVETELPVAPITPIIEPQEKEPAEYVEEIDELIKLLETDTSEEQEKAADTPSQVLPPVEQEVKLDIDELKKQAFTPRAEDEKVDEDLSDVRQVALGGEEEVFVEVEAKAQDPWEERIKTVENALRPYRTYIYYVLAFLGVVMAVMASVLVYNGIKQALPTPVPTEAPNLPYPITVSLPGGLNFNLAKGTLKDGVWNPRGPEWLEGTEICRWVAIPWSRQLEAAVRTMNREDAIELLMSNNDRLSYKVESVQELTPAQLQEMDSSVPCLAVILAKQDSEKRWVAVGRP